MRTQTTALMLFTTLTLGMLGCNTPGDSGPNQELAAALDDLISTTVSESATVRGAALHVDAPGFDLWWEGAAGTADEAGSPMTPATPVRIASNTKTYVAAAALRLREQGKLALDDAIAAHLPLDFVDRLRADGYAPESMTVRHLLTHTSGLFDHSESENYEAAIVADPMHRWTPAEQFGAAIEWGDPLGLPGEFYSYCDTGYILLGVIIERASGQPLASAVRDLTGFERLGLGSTWWESLENHPPGVPDRAHQFLGDLDTAAFDPSFDLYGGGGLAATVGDMAVFYRALFTGGIFEDSETLDTMLTTIDGAQARPDAGPGAMAPGAYRMGIWIENIDGLITYRHTGFWGTLATYVPDLEATITCTVNQNQAKAELIGMTEKAIALLKDAGSKMPDDG